MNLIDVSTKLQTEDQCLDFIEKVRWPDGKIRCVRCGNDKVSRITRTVDPAKKKQNKRRRLYACLEPTCNHRFTPTVGTLFHDSHLPLTKWFAAVALIVHAKKGMSAKQVERHLGINYRTAWYMGHRIRKAMASGEGLIIQTVSSSGPNARELPFGPFLSGTVEIDETYIGGKTVRRKERGNRKRDKEAVVGMIERGGQLRLRHVGKGNPTAAQVAPLVRELVDRDVDRVITDESTIYPFAFDGYCASKHETIAHKYEYVRGDVHTNTIESAFSLLKRGIVGSFHRVSHKHLHRYLSEFEYRFNRRENQRDLFGATVTNLVGTKEMKYQDLIAKLETTR